MTGMSEALRSLHGCIFPVWEFATLSRCLQLGSSTHFVLLTLVPVAIDLGSL